MEEIEKEQDEASTSTIAPLDALSPRHSKSVWSIEGGSRITTTQLLGYMLHRENYVHDRAVASVGLSCSTRGNG